MPAGTSSKEAANRAKRGADELVGATRGELGFFWLLSDERGASECRLLSGVPSY